MHCLFPRWKAEQKQNEPETRKDHRLHPFPYPLPRESPLAEAREWRRVSKEKLEEEEMKEEEEWEKRVVRYKFPIRIRRRRRRGWERQRGATALKRRGNKITSGSGAKKTPRMGESRGEEDEVVVEAAARETVPEHFASVMARV